MSLDVLALVLVAAAAHAVWNTAAKCKRGPTAPFVWASTAASAVLCVPVAAVGVASGATSITPGLVLAAAVSGLLHVAYSLVLQTGYDRADLGVVYPVARGTGPVLVVVGAVLVLGERPAPLEVVGALVVVLGMAVVTGNPVAGGRGRPAAGVVWGAATGVVIAAYTLWDGWSITALHADPVAYFAVTLLTETAVLAPVVLRDRGAVLAVLRSDPVTIPVVAVLSPVAYVSVLFALQRAPIAVVAPLRETSIVLASLLAWRLFGEQHLGRRLVGAGVVLVGIVVVSVR